MRRPPARKDLKHMPEQQKNDPAELRRLVRELQRRTARNELEKENMRIMRGKLDAQLEFFKHIHRFSQSAFSVTGMSEFAALFAEGIVDIFQLETSAAFLTDVAGDKLHLAGACNLEADITELPVTKEWLAKPELLHFKRQGVVVESPPGEDSPFACLDLAHAIYMTIFDNLHKPEGFILGGITKDGSLVYDFRPEAVSLPFLVYCRNMNGIYNNLIALDRAKTAVEAKTRFLSNLSHEIRTPMNAIIGMTQIAERNREPEEMLKCITQIGISSHHLLGLVNDVLDMSKIEEGKLALENKAFTPDSVLDNIISSLHSGAAGKGLSLSLNTRGTKDLSLIGDPMRLSQVLINFISNAIKFTNAGGAVTLCAEVLSRDPEKALLLFSVEDTGIGMSEEVLSRIFTPFEQADSSTSRKYGGTGLGLSISRNIVAHGQRHSRRESGGRRLHILLPRLVRHRQERQGGERGGRKEACRKGFLGAHDPDRGRRGHQPRDHRDPARGNGRIVRMRIQRSRGTGYFCRIARGSLRPDPHGRANARYGRL